METSLKQRLIRGADFFIAHQNELDTDKNKELVLKFSRMVKEYLQQETLLTS